MLRIIQNICFLLLISIQVVAVEIESFYGPINIEEPVLIELIKSPAFQRLKHVNQYGIASYTTHREKYSRYDHSVGVFALLRAKNCPLEEQIAGLLHDVSHTIFSHVGDWIFNRQNQEIDYQSITHTEYLKKSGLEDILNRHGYNAKEMLPTQRSYPALEQPLPNLCADRLDYNIQGAFHQGFITKEEALELFQEIQYVNGHWISQNHKVLKKLVRYSLYMTENCWGSGTEYVLSMWLAEAILRSVKIGLITMNEIHFGFDQDVWDTLMSSSDHFIQECMHKILHHPHYHSIVNHQTADLIVFNKFRGIDPWVVSQGRLLRLTATDPVLAYEFLLSKEKMARGWPIKLH